MGKEITTGFKPGGDSEGTAPDGEDRAEYHPPTLALVGAWEDLTKQYSWSVPMGPE